jgi:microcystin degradation protein MlrC
MFGDPTLQRLRSELADDGIELVPGLSAYAEPAAPVQARTHVELRQRLLDELQRSLPVDAVMLHLHGAMVSQQCDDCEGDLLTRIREMVGPRVPIGAILDPHAHLTPAMVAHADMLAFMKEYPHTDWAQRKDAVIRVLRGILSGQITPTPAVVDCHMQGFFPTQTEPMRGFVSSLRMLEEQGAVLDVSFVHGFPFGDTEFTGSKFLVYTNGDAGAAARAAEALRSQLWSMRREVMLSLFTLEQSLAEMALPRTRPLVVADFADNPGGGAPSDNVSILRAMIGKGITNAVVGLICDPQAVRTCQEVGIGSRIDLRIGGKTGRASGLPIDLEADVLGLASEAYLVSGDERYPLGDTAWLRHNGIDIVLSSRRMQLSDPSGLTHLGIDPSKYSTIVVKSSNHFAAGFAQVAGQVMHVSAAGALDTNLLNIPYRKLKSRWYPKDPDPISG